MNISGKLQNTFFGKLDKKYCYYFEAIGTINIIIALVAVFAFFLGIFTNKLPITSMQFVITKLVNPILFLALVLFSYLQSRLLYQMCINT